MSEVSGDDEAVPTVEWLSGQIDRLSLADQVHLLQCLAHAIERKLGMPAANSALDISVSDPPSSGTISPELESITYRIIGCAQAVHRQLGRGLREDNYQRALEARFIQAGLACRPQQQFAVYDLPQNKADLGRLLGYYIADFVVEDQVIVEIKALAATDASHLAQVIGYLAVSGCPVGLLINFGERSLHPRRIFRPLHLESHHLNTQWLWNPSRT